MKTKTIPIMVTLLAALISCICSIVQGAPFDVFTIRLLWVVIIFGIFGVILRVVIERSFKVMEDSVEEPEEESSEEQEILEDIQSEEE